MLIIKKLLNSVKVGAMLSLLALGIVFATSSVGGVSAACEPDPVNPLKCFCEEIKGDLKTASEESKNICQLNDIDQKKDSKEGLLSENGIVKKVFNLLSWLTGLLAAVYLIIGGFKIIVSGGNSDSVTSGRKMIIYAMVGLVVVISSNLIINFVIGLVNNASK